MNESLINLTEAQKVLGIGKSKMYQLIKNGEIPHLYIGKGYKIRRSALDEYIKSHEKRGQTWQEQ